MDDDLKNSAWSLTWLTVIALCASTVRWHELVYDKDGKFRWGLVVVQVASAFAIGVLARSVVPIVLHFFPYAGDNVADGLAGVLAFAGPLAVTRAIDVFLGRFGGK